MLPVLARPQLDNISLIFMTRTSVYEPERRARGPGGTRPRRLAAAPAAARAAPVTPGDDDHHTQTQAGIEPTRIAW
jgi:hypothetical protein